MTTETSEHSLRLSRLVPAPADRAFAAWTDPTILKRWYAPAPASVGSVEVDVRKGGAWRVRMDAPDGAVYTCTGRYTEVDPPRRLVFTFDWIEDGPRMGIETVVTVTFEEVDGGTEVVVVHSGLPSPGEAEGHSSGWAACLDQLVEAAAGS